MSKFLGWPRHIPKSVTKFNDLAIDGGIKNGFVRPSTVKDSAILSFINKGGAGKVRYTLAIPNDYVSGTDLIVKLFWSPADIKLGRSGMAD
jgi:hypothetical protein